MVCNKASLHGDTPWSADPLECADVPSSWSNMPALLAGSFMVRLLTIQLLSVADLLDRHFLNERRGLRASFQYLCTIGKQGNSHMYFGKC